MAGLDSYYDSNYGCLMELVQKYDCDRLFPFYGSDLSTFVGRIRIFLVNTLPIELDHLKCYGLGLILKENVLTQGRFLTFYYVNKIFF